jgi:OPT oligopeptide transporter protein
LLANKKKAAFGNPLWVPFQALANTFVGYVIGISIFVGVYYGNLFDAKKFPFMSTMLFSQTSTEKKFVSYNQTAILNQHFEVDENKLNQHGVPWLTATNAIGMAVQNMSITAVFTHMFLWHWNDIKISLEVFQPLKKFFKPKEWAFPKFWKSKDAGHVPLEEADAICSHHLVMQSYDDVPTWWFGTLWVVSAILGLIMSRITKSTLEVWAYFIAIIVPAISLPFTGVLYAMYGVPVNVQPLIQMIGAYLLPRRPLANLYFSGFGYDSLYQGKVMLRVSNFGKTA